MANTLLTPQIIAREALIRLESNMVMPNLVHREYSREFRKVGDTVNIRKPAVFTAEKFTTTTTTQDVTEDNTDVKLDTHADVTVEITSKELTLDIVDFGEQVIDGAVLAMSELVDQEICKLYKAVPYWSGVAGTTPAAIDDVTAARLLLNQNKVPMPMRRLVLDPVAESKLLELDSLHEVDKSGSSMGLRDAMLGRIMGLDTYMDQNIQTHVAGDYAALADVTVGAAIKGATSVVLTSGAGSSTDALNEGDIFTIDSGEAAGQYTVTATTADAIAGVVTATIYPGLKGATAGTEAVTFADETSGGHVASLAFHRNAFALVSAPLAAPMGGTEWYTAFLPNGLSIRVVMAYNHSAKKNLISFDCLFGAKAIYPELAVRVLG